MLASVKTCSSITEALQPLDEHKPTRRAAFSCTPAPSRMKRLAFLQDTHRSSQMKQTVEFFFDFVSPYSYLAHSQLDSLQADISLRPMHVLSVMKAVGNTPTTVTCAAKGRYA